MFLAQVDDKVRLKIPKAVGKRGIVNEVQSEELVVRLEASGEQVRVAPSDVTNFSLAARKVWVKMPDRRVGRPKGNRTSDRVSVTLRIDRELWKRFRAAEDEGKIADRTKTINELLRERLDDLCG